MAISKFERPKNSRERVRDYLRVFRGAAQAVLLTGAVKVANNTLGRLARRWINGKIARGETLWLDDFPGPAVSEQQKFAEYPEIKADMSPNTDVQLRKSRFIATEPPPPVYPFAYREPPLSGGVISGQGETEKRRPHHLFFDLDLAWGKLMWGVLLFPATKLINRVTDLFWDDRRRWGVVASKQQRVADSQKMTDDIKAFAKANGAALVGVTTLADEHRFEDFDDPYKYAISIAIPMDREEMQHLPTERSYTEIFRIYRDVGRVAIDVAEHIRSLGYPALAGTNIAPGTTVVLHIPIAVQAGLGQLGKHGSMITKEYGSNVRLATILTDLPLVPDAPVDLGVDDFCLNCKICTTNCPPHAIFQTKQIVRGDEKWYVDFDTCVPYFVANQTCGICIEVCPWSTPGGGKIISEKMLELRGEVANAG